MQQNFTILNQGAALEQPTFPIRPQLLRVPELCRAAILDCRLIHRCVRVLWETFLNDQLFKKDYPLQSSTIQRIWHLHLRSQNLIFPRREMKRESLNTPTQSPHCQSRSGMLNHTGGTYSHSGMTDYPRVPITEWNLGKFPDSYGISKQEDQLQN